MRQQRRVTTQPKESIRISIGQSDAEEQWSTGYTQSERDSEKEWRNRVTNFQEWVVHERGLTEEVARAVETALLGELLGAGHACTGYGKQKTTGGGLYSVFGVKHSGLIYHDLGIACAAMATVWMDMAVQQDELVEALDGPRDDPKSASDLFRRHVGTVCGGLAFELLWKALVQLEEKIVRPIHQPGKIMGDVCERIRGQVEAAAKRTGWTDLQELHEFLDVHLCNPDVKYCLRTPDGRAGRGFPFWREGRRSLRGLKELHTIVHNIWNAEFAKRRLVVSHGQAAANDEPGG